MFSEDEDIAFFKHSFLFRHSFLHYICTHTLAHGKKLLFPEDFMMRSSSCNYTAAYGYPEPQFQQAEPIFQVYNQIQP